MSRDGGLRCKCNQAATRHQSRKPGSWGHWYYACYKAFKPGHCGFFAWEQQPTPPVTPEMSPKQRGNAPLPKTPSRQQGSSQQQPKSPHWGKLYKMAQECSNEEDESDDPFTTASQTTPISPYKDKGVDRRYSGQASSSLRPASSFSPTKYATPSTGARGLVRAATEGDLQPSYEELLRKMERMQGQLDERQEQIEKREAQIQTLIEENAILRRGSTLFETPSQRQLFPPSPTKSSSQTPKPPSPIRNHEIIDESPRQRIIDEPPRQRDNIFGAQSHFKIAVPSNDSPIGTRNMWN